MKIGLLTAIPHDDLPISHLHAQMLSVPLGSLYVATYLLNHRNDVQIIIRDDPEPVFDARPDIVGIYSVTQNFNYARQLAQRAKTNGALTVVGGPHITALPHRLPPEFDFGVIGEGEKTFVELVGHVSGGAGSTDEIWKKVPGLTYHDRRSRTFFTGRRHEEKDLDHFPFPQRSLWAKRLGIAHMMTSRGCPFSCSFCSEAVLWDQYRIHSAPYVLEEVKDILDHFKVPHILIGDDIFTVSAKRVREMADLFEEEGITGRVAFSCWGRAHLINEEMVQLLKRMNFVYIAFGIESASPRVLSHLKKGATIDSNQRAIDLCHQAGLKIGCTFVISSPHESVEDLEMTYRFIRKNERKISGIEINPAVPLPGTPLWVDALNRGLVSEEMDWSRLRDYSVFEEFDRERYVVINEHFSKPAYQELFKRMNDLYTEIINRGEIAELTLGYLNPTAEPAAFNR